MKKILGILGGCALLMAGPARAQSSSDPAGTDMKAGTKDNGMGPGGIDNSGKGGSGSLDPGTGGTGVTVMKGAQQIEGKVLKASSTLVVIEHMGVAVPLELKIGTSIKGAKSAESLKEGQQIRAGFELSGDRNLASSIEVMGGTGGSGELDKVPSDVPLDTNDKGLNQPVPPLPESAP